MERDACRVSWFVGLCNPSTLRLWPSRKRRRVLVPALQPAPQAMRQQVRRSDTPRHGTRYSDLLHVCQVEP
jgi:hypothetical protein